MAVASQPRPHLLPATRTTPISPLCSRPYHCQRDAASCLYRQGTQCQATSEHHHQPSSADETWWKRLGSSVLSLGLSASMVLQSAAPGASSAAASSSFVSDQPVPEQMQGQMPTAGGPRRPIFSVAEAPKALTPRERANAYDLGGYSFGAATSSAAASKLIDQGLLLAYNFNQYEARRAFQAALALDPSAVMAYWGLAYSNGPFLNKAAVPAPADGSYPVFTSEELQAGRQAIESGLKVADRKLAAAKRKRSDPQLEQLQKERAFLVALAPVFQAPTPYGDAWKAANDKYALAMEKWAAEHPKDAADALALAADAWCNEQPWQFWDTSASPPTPRGRTPHIINLLQRSLAAQPGHPLAAHLLIHTTEARDPEGAALAVAAADSLATRYADMGHLVHMASHTYLRVGRWHDAVEVNKKATQVDNKHINAGLQPEYPCHDAVMGVWAAMEGAEKEAALELATTTSTLSQTMGPMYMSEGRDRIVKPMVQLRFADWEALQGVTGEQVDQRQDNIMLPAYAPEYSQALYHYAKAMAAAAHVQPKPPAPAVTTAAPPVIPDGSIPATPQEPSSTSLGTPANDAQQALSQDVLKPASATVPTLTVVVAVAADTVEPGLSTDAAPAVVEEILDDVPAAVAVIVGDAPAAVAFVADAVPAVATSIVGSVPAAVPVAQVAEVPVVEATPAAVAEAPSPTSVTDVNADAAQGADIDAVDMMVAGAAPVEPVSNVAAVEAAVDMAAAEPAVSVVVADPSAESAASEAAMEVAVAAPVTEVAAAPAAADPWRERAEAAQAELAAVVDSMPEDPPTLPGDGLGLYSLGYKAVAQQAQQVVAARLAVLDGQWERATSLLQDAVAAESRYGYTEPPRFYQPQGECLGWVLLQQGRLAEAAQAYMQVLNEHPRSPWALIGLQQVYAAAAADAGAAAAGAGAGQLGARSLGEGVLSREVVDAQLAQVYKEAKGAAVKLPSSCPMFSEPAEPVA